jgi:hypothetical protein
MFSQSTTADNGAAVIGCSEAAVAGWQHAGGGLVAGLCLAVQSMWHWHALSRVASDCLSLCADPSACWLSWRHCLLVN